jgi:hypothetical protein
MEQMMANQDATKQFETASARSGAAIAQRWVVSLHMAALAIQIVFAVLLLAGVSGMLQLHSINTWAVLTCGAIQTVVVVLSWPSGSTFWKPAAVVIPLAEMAQIYFGRSGNLPMHVTLGTVVWGVSLALLIQVWAPSWGRQYS